MNAIEVIKVGLEQSKMWTLGLISDMKDAPMTFPTPKGGNHPLWVLGHLIHSEAGLVSTFIQGNKPPLSKWNTLFGRGSEPVADADAYPTIEELMSEFEKVRADTLEMLNSLTEADFDKPSHAPEENKHIFGTIGQCLVMIGLHYSYHAGQVADARRALGKKALLG